MNSETIKEIAKQLGVGTDCLLDHMAELAPKWAAFKVARTIAYCLTMSVVVAILATVAVWTFRRALDDSRKDYIDIDAYLLVAAITGFISLLLFISLSFSAMSLTGYLVSPDAALLNDLLNAASGS